MFYQKNVIKLGSRIECVSPHRLVSKGCIIRNIINFINCTKKRKKLETNLCSRKNIHSSSGARMRPQVCTMMKQGHVKLLL